MYITSCYWVGSRMDQKTASEQGLRTFAVLLDSWINQETGNDTSFWLIFFYLTLVFLSHFFFGKVKYSFQQAEFAHLIEMMIWRLYSNIIIKESLDTTFKTIYTV